MNSMKESLLSFSGANVPIDEVAKIMKKDQQFIKIGLQEKWLPIGIAYQMNDTQEFSYYISPKKLYEYTGYIYQGQSFYKLNIKSMKNKVSYKLTFYNSSPLLSITFLYQS